MVLFVCFFAGYYSNHGLPSVGLKPKGSSTKCGLGSAGSGSGSGSGSESGSESSCRGTNGSTLVSQQQQKEGHFKAFHVFLKNEEIAFIIFFHKLVCFSKTTKNIQLIDLFKKTESSSYARILCLYLLSTQISQVLM